MTMAALYKEYGISPDTQDFIGHTIALETSDDYLQRPALPTVRKIKLYEESLEQYGTSPYVYPQYGLGELPQVFARLCAVWGGTYMLNKPVDEIVYDSDGKACGVRSEGETAKAKFVVGDPSYFPEKVVQTAQIVRCICILSALPNISIGDAKSAQIILPQSQVNRKNDIYVAITSFPHRVCPEGKYIAIIATKVETDTPKDEIRPGLELLGNNVLEKFESVSPFYEPKSDGKEEKAFVSKSYDASTHFETVTDDVLSLWNRITGEPFDWNKKPPKPQGQGDDDDNDNQ
jgi:Rab GDP dissociation inhibitor